MKGATVAVLLALLVIAAHTVLVTLHAPGGHGMQDVYSYFLPNVLYTLDALEHGGRGLLWNPFQGFGHPYFANTVTGLLYPPDLAFAFFDPMVAIHAVLLFNLFVGSVGMYFFCRELGLERTASFGGAIAFEIGFPTLYLLAWSPMHNGPWVWLPWALFFCERLLRDARASAALALGGVLALQILPGFVLIAALTYQLIALRLAWELITRWSQRRWRPYALVAGGMLLAPLLVAVQLVPAFEYASQSIRTAVPATDFLSRGELPWSAAVADAARRGTIAPYLVAPLLLAGIAPLAQRTRRLACFFLLVGAAYALLGFGYATPLFDVYLRFPPGAAVVRVPYRLFWVTGFCLSVLAALALQALAERTDPAPSRRARVGAAAALAVLLCAWAPGGVRAVELVAAAALALAAVVALKRQYAPLAAWIALAAVALNLAGQPVSSGGTLDVPLSRLRTYQPTFERIRARLGSEGRVFLIPDLRSGLSFELMAKTAQIMRVPHIFDFEGLPELRVAQYVAEMRLGHPIADVVQAYVPAPAITPEFRRRLLDLASVRYLVTTPRLSEVEDLGLPRARFDTQDLRVYRNDGALPRARFVSRVSVVDGSMKLLTRLADGGDDLRSVALLEDTPPSHFLGTPGGSGEVRFAVDDPERLVFEVDAQTRGFLFVADQHYPGWEAHVNGVAAPILRANYLFRLVEVPAGQSRVEMRYRPASVRIGAAISLATLVALALALWRRRSGARRRARPAA